MGARKPKILDTGLRRHDDISFFSDHRLNSPALGVNTSPFVQTANEGADKPRSHKRSHSLKILLSEGILIFTGKYSCRLNDDL
jgi:hypothetical protein